MKKILQFLTSSRFLLSITFIINVALFAFITFFIGSYVYTLISILAMFIVIGFLNKHNEASSYKIMWLVIIFVMPVFGVALYLQLKTTRGPKRERRRYQHHALQAYKLFEQDSEVLNSLEKFNADSANLSKYLINTEKYPVHTNSTTQYLKDGEIYFEDLFEALNNAKKYILLEFFIIAPGNVWDRLFEILRFKAREGVEIKLIYDDFGCIDRFQDKRYFEKLINHGIEAVCFNKIAPVIATFSQYRDHRKIVIIDGEIAYTGGLNIADEYANKKKKFGHWKDTAVKIQGAAVWNFIIMFFIHWQYASKKAINISKYKVEFENNNKLKECVQPYATGPITQSPIARNAFMKIISGAEKYIYITTPYLIIDHEMMHLIKIVSLSGVDVRIIMPGIPDKRWIFYLSRSYYADLIKSGVKIYEYTPGFVHAKMLVSDDATTIIGSTNFDFRSLYLHFEAGAVIHNSKTVLNVKNDIYDIIANSHLVTLRDLKQRKWYERMSAQVLKFFAPLM